MVRCALLVLVGCSAGRLSVERVDPPSGTNLAPVPVQIEGAGFHLGLASSLDGDKTVVAPMIVSLNAIVLGDAVWRGEDLIEGTVPAGLPEGSYDVTVTIGGGTATLSDGYTVANPGPDAGVDAPLEPDAPAFATEVLTIQGTGELATSAQVLALGVTYTLTASGYVQVAAGGGYDSDAEYWGFPTFMNDNTDDGLVDMGLGIDDDVIDTVKTRWGAYQPSHVYTISYVGRGQPLTARYEDNYYANNTGTMTLQISQP